jgi:hypothetical protein
MKFVREQFYLTARAQNLKRLARFLKSRSLESAPIPIGDRKRKRDTPPQGITSAQKSSTTSEFFDNYSDYHYLIGLCLINALTGHLVFLPCWQSE